MPEFILASNLAAKLNINESELPRFESEGVIKPVSKNGNTYYSARDFYRLKGVLHFVTEQGLSTDEALERLQNWNWFAQGAAAAAR